MSPDFKELFVSSSQNNRVMKYDYDAATGVATNPTIFADATGGLAFPNDIQFSPDGSKVYVANLGGGVSPLQRRWNQRGSKAAIRPESATRYVDGICVHEGIAGWRVFDSSGRRRDRESPISQFHPSWIPFAASPAITGATGLMIHDGYLYVSGLFASDIRRLQFVKRHDGRFVGDQQCMISPGPGRDTGRKRISRWHLGISSGSGNISRYSFDGRSWAHSPSPGGGGFTEATAFVVVPTSRHRRFQ